MRQMSDEVAEEVVVNEGQIVASLQGESLFTKRKQNTE